MPARTHPDQTTTPVATPALRCQDLVIGYQGTAILDGLSFTVETGSTTALVGPSGCGKTTLLKTLAGILAPIDGRATVLDHHLPRTPPPGTVGYIPQSLGLVMHASALRNVLHGRLPTLGRSRSLLGRFPSTAIGAAKASLDEVGLADEIHQRVKTLSGGQRRRVAIARALVQAPRVLLADEILAELDVATAETIVGLLESMQAANEMTIVLVEHDPAVAERVADRVLHLGTDSEGARGAN